MAKKYASFLKEGGQIYEMVYNKEENTTQFVTMTNGEVEYLEKVEQNGETYYPYPATNNILKYGAVLFPTEALDYETDKKLLEEIYSFIHKYLDLSDFFQEITPYYVLFTWIYDNFEELPYLRAIGDYGTGKSRFLKTVGSICYKPMFTFAATTTSPIFRMIEEYKGTLIIDEADMKYSDSNSDIIQILNTGYQKDIPILRAGEGKENFNPTSYQVFGPKLLASRNNFQDQALESRCLIEKMGSLKRKDIPHNLNDNFRNEALRLRNKLLLWRLKNYGMKKGKEEIYNDAIEPRLNQIIYPLSSVIDDKEIMEKLKKYIKNYNQELITDRGLTIEATILRIIIVLIRNNNFDITVQKITTIYNSDEAKEDKNLSAKRIGGILRKKLGLKTERRNMGYILDIEHAKNEIPNICKKYGFSDEEVNKVNLPYGSEDFVEELKDMNLPAF